MCARLTGVCMSQATTGAHPNEEKFPSQFMYRRVCIYMQIVFVYEDVFLYKGFCYAFTHPTIKVYHRKLNKHRKEFKLAFKLWCACSESAVLLHSAWHTQLEYLGSSQLHSEPADEKKASIPTCYANHMQIYALSSSRWCLPKPWSQPTLHYNYEVWIICWWQKWNVNILLANWRRWSILRKAHPRTNEQQTGMFILQRIKILRLHDDGERAKACWSSKINIWLTVALCLLLVMLIDGKIFIGLWKLVFSAIYLDGLVLIMNGLQKKGFRTCMRRGGAERSLGKAVNTNLFTEIVQAWKQLSYSTLHNED